MIKEFEISDLDGFEPNELSDPKDSMHIFDETRWWNYTIVNDGIVKAIICFCENKPGDWAALALVSIHFNARDSVELRRFLPRAEKALKPKRLWTLVRNDPVSSRWHEFLGFKYERPQELDGVVHNIYSRVSA
jgi:hypothetical protein